MTRLLSFLMAWLMAMSSWATPAAAQNIGDFDKLTRVGAFRNYVLNPSAQFHTLGVTTSNATATRSTTTPVGEGGTEWNVTITSANGYVDFSQTGATIANLGGARCEASIRARGFQASSLFQVLLGSTILHSVAIGPLATAQYVTIDFICPPDPATLKTRITDSATLAATNEVAESYLGRSRNIGTAQQGEHVGTLIYPAATNCQWSNTSTYPNVQGYAVDADCGTPTVTGTLTAPATKIPGFTMNVTPGRYSIRAQSSHYSSRSAVGDTFCTRFSDGTNNTPLQCTTIGAGGATVVNAGTGLLLGEIEYTSTGSVTVQIQGGNDGASTFLDARAQPLSFSVSRLPAASTVAVSPSQQAPNGIGYFGTTSGAYWVTNSGSINRGTLTGTLTRTYVGTASAPTNLADAAVKFLNLPAGTYEFSAPGFTGYTETAASAGDQTACQFNLSDGTLVSATFDSLYTATATSRATGKPPNDLVRTYTSPQASVEIFLEMARSGGSGNCYLTPGSSGRPYAITAKRIDPLPSSAPVFVKAPVLAETTGAALPSTAVGAVIANVAGSTSTINSAAQLSTVTLDPGNYTLWLSAAASGAGGAADYLQVRITTASSPTVLGGTLNDDTYYDSITTGGRGSIFFLYPVDPTVTTTYYLHGLAAASGATTTTGRIRVIRR